MRFVLAANWYILLWATTTVAVPTSDQLLQRAVPIPPTDDPFYVPPTALENSQPGTILRSRSINDLSIGGVVPFQAEAAYQLLYRTTDSLGDASAAVTTIVVPKNANSSRLLSYQMATDAAWPNCAPSYILQLGSSLKNGGSGAAETLLVIAALNQGWIVNLPDYEGLESAFTSGIQAGQATLDSVRAALSSGDLTSISSQAEYQMWGYSGGSLASEWAAELQPSYAPELNFKGTALGGLVPNITSVMLSSNKGLFTGLIPAGVIGLTNGYPVLKEYLHKNLVPSTASKFYKASTQCLGSNIASFLGQDIGLYLDHGLSTLFTSIAKDVLAITGQMGLYGTPKMPIFLYKAISDEVSVVGDTDAVVSKLCSQGANINYARDMFGGHATEAITGAGDAFTFLIDRFNGVPTTSGCTTNNVWTVTFNPRAITALGPAVASALLALLQVPVGPSDMF
ncbi:hypothetical protein ACHAQE_003752 [Botrytis cinerea]|uniref:Similar to secretory lipase 1 n=1 Tax=Botryotinia fuckeliana (strain T4) TaxID=999810 RepID=G2YM81_BOTF4|nr:similar to secretory lipase 1 precursor [Botrytis cinerea T4]